jgi:DNA repair exonuclease SbcCD ATPase subunit
MRLKEVSMRGFRAFNAPFSFPIHNELTIIVGDNATGKTSFCDAIQWGLFGKLPQYKDIPEAALEDMILNRNSPSREATVTITLKEDDKASALQIQRQVRSKRIVKPTQLIPPKLLEGSKEELSKLGETTLDSFLTTVYLRQEALRRFIEADPLKQRRPILSSLLGIGFVEAVQQGLKEGMEKLDRRKTLKDREVSERSNERSIYIERLKAFESLKSDVTKRYELGTKEVDLPSAFVIANSLFSELRNLTNSIARIFQVGEPKLDLTSLREFHREVSGLVERWRIEISQESERARTLRIKQDGLKNKITGLDEKDIVQNIQNIEKSLREEKEKLRTKNAYLNLLSFAGDYLKFEKPPECPVCENKIDAQAVLDHVKRIMQGLEEKREIENIRRNIETLDNTKRELGSNLQDFRGLKEELKKTEEELTSYREIEGVQQRLEKLNLEVGKLNDFLNVIEDEVGIARLEVLSEEELSAIGSSLQNLTRLLRSVEALYKASETGLPSFIEHRLEKLNPTVDRYTRILSPHPEFSRLRVTRTEDGSYWLQGLSGEEGKKTHVRTLFSTAQLNEAAIVLLLSMAEMGPQDLEFIVLDDPTQSIASQSLGSHKERLAKLIVKASTQKQTIVATMDLEFAQLLKSLQPNAQAYLFKDYSEEKGPVVEKW